MCNEQPAVGKHSVLMPRLSVAGGFNRFHVPPLLKVMTVRMLGFFPTFRDFLRCFMLRRRKNNNGQQQCTSTSSTHQQQYTSSSKYTNEKCCYLSAVSPLALPIVLKELPVPTKDSES